MAAASSAAGLPAAAVAESAPAGGAEMASAGLTTHALPWIAERWLSFQSSAAMAKRSTDSSMLKRPWYAKQAEAKTERTYENDN